MAEICIMMLIIVGQLPLIWVTSQVLIDCLDVIPHPRGMSKIFSVRTIPMGPRARLQNVGPVCETVGYRREQIVTNYCIIIDTILTQLSGITREKRQELVTSGTTQSSLMTPCTTQSSLMTPCTTQSSFGSAMPTGNDIVTPQKSRTIAGFTKCSVDV